MRFFWNNFEAGERPGWDAGKIGSPAYTQGFRAAENCLFEDGSARKRLGLHSITKQYDGTTISAHTPSAEPFIPGYGPYAWDKTGHYYIYGGARVSASDYVYRPVTFAPLISTPSYAMDNLICYSDGTSDQVYAWKAAGSQAYTGKGRFAVDASGRRIMARQFPTNNSKIEFHTSSAGDVDDGWTFGDTGKTLNAVVAAGSFIVGKSYTIASIGTTNFMSIGATANTVGLTFKATGVGAGTGTATAYINVLYPSDPIDINFSGIGNLAWISEGFGLFIGTDKGIYEIISGYGPGFSPLNGGFYPQSLGNYACMALTHPMSKTKNQHVTMTQECVVFTSDVDTITAFNRKAKQAQRLKLDVPPTHAIDSLAWIGGNLVAVLLADITARATWGAAAYNAADNILLIVNETNGVISRFTGLSAFTIAGIGGKGLVMKTSDGVTLRAGVIPYQFMERYMNPPADFDPATFYDGNGAPYSMRLLTMPLNSGMDIGDEKKIGRVRVRVRDSRSLSVRQVGGPTETWTYDLPPPALFSGDVELNVYGSFAGAPQLEIFDSSPYPLEILAVQADVDLNITGGNE